MRYEVIRLLQFVFSLSLVFGAFGGGLYVGWRRWGRPERVAEARAGRRSGPSAARAAAWDRMDPAAGARWDVAEEEARTRSALFAPEVSAPDERFSSEEFANDVVRVVRGELPSGAARAS